MYLCAKAEKTKHSTWAEIVGLIRGFFSAFQNYSPGKHFSTYCILLEYFNLFPFDMTDQSSVESSSS